jgi:hypothetical protein
MAHPVERGNGLMGVDASGSGNEPSYCSAMSGNHNLLSLLHPIQQGPQRVLGGESPYFPHVLSSPA